MTLNQYDSADETNADDEERISLVTKATAESESSSSAPYKPKTIRSAQKESTSANWKVVSQVLLLVAVGMAVLVMTDTIEINFTNKGEFEQGDVEMRIPSKPRPASSIMDVPDDAGNIDFGGPVKAEATEDDDSNDDGVGEHNDSAGDNTDSAWTSPVKNEPNKNLPEAAYIYRPRAQPYDKQEDATFLKEWNGWSMTKARSSSLDESFYVKYPNRDIPKGDFPDSSWQRDEAYLEEFISQSSDLMDRAMAAIWKEYGKEVGDAMFDLELYNFTDPSSKLPKTVDGAGWSTEGSLAGLKRRLLHAILTEDSFTWAMSGHSASAGHGNLFQQSYTEQIQWIMEAVFSRLGVKHEARNIGMGGLGTLQTGLGAASILGPHVDVLMWDSGMTEKEKYAPEILLRQQLLGGLRVPVFWSFPNDVMQFYEKLGIHVGGQGSCKTGIDKKEKMSDFDNAPWASRYLNCDGSLHDHCRSKEYRGHCWIKRDDVQPVATQNPEPGGRASWHPGDRHHQLRGRALTMVLLKALKEIFEEWKSKDNFVWEDDEWHVTNLYEEQRKAVEGVKLTDCGQKFELQKFCDIPFRAITEFTPRAFPSLTSIRSAMPTAQLEHINDAPKNIYESPDVFNPDLHPPKGEVDVLKIVELGDSFGAVNVPDYTGYYQNVDVSAEPSQPVGKGIYLDTKAGDIFCDGTVNSFCGKGKGDNCLLYGHNDGRNGLIHGSLSGWVFFRLKIKEGLVSLKIESWHWPDDNPKTEGWKTVNNEGAETDEADSTGNSQGEDENRQRNLKRAVPDFCKDFALDISVDGEIRTLNKQEVGGGSNSDLKYKPQRVVEIMHILDDPTLTGGVEKEVEFGVQMRGCGGSTRKTFKLTHVYFA